MQALWWGLLAALAVAPARAQSAAPPLGPGVDAIVARYLAARGGEARIRAVRSERLIGLMTFADGASGSDTVELARPLRIRTTIHVAGRAVVQGYDGDTAWTVDPFQGDTAPHPLDSATARNVIAGADMDGPLVDVAAKGERITLAGVDTADGRPAWALRVRWPGGTTDTWFVDTTTFLITKWQGSRTIHGSPLTFDTWFRDYRRMDGLMFSFLMESDTRGRPGSQRVVFDTVQVDPPIGAGRFRMPE